MGLVFLESEFKTMSRKNANQSKLQTYKSSEVQPLDVLSKLHPHYKTIHTVVWLYFTYYIRRKLLNILRSIINSTSEEPALNEVSKQGLTVQNQVKSALFNLLPNSPHITKEVHFKIFIQNTQWHCTHAKNNCNLESNVTRDSLK